MGFFGSLRAFERLVIFAAAVMMISCRCALAEDLIVMPTAETLSLGAGAQLLDTVQNKPRSYGIFTAGIPQAEFQAAHLSRSGIGAVALSAQTTVLPETFITPEVSVGIRDIGNATHGLSLSGYQGRSVYLVATKFLDDAINPPKIKGVKLTAGLGLGSIRGLFGGGTVALPYRLSGTVEYDSQRLNYRLALPVLPIASIAYERIAGRKFVGIDLHAVLGK